MMKYCECYRTECLSAEFNGTLSFQIFSAQVDLTVAGKHALTVYRCFSSCSRCFTKANNKSQERLLKSLWSGYHTLVCGTEKRDLMKITILWKSISVSMLFHNVTFLFILLC